MNPPVGPVHRGIREPEVTPSDESAWRAVVRVLRSTGLGALDSLSTVVFPADCRVCGLPLAGFTLLPVCSCCWNDLPPQTGSLCARCGEALGSGFVPDPASDEAAVCRPCKTVPPDFAKAVAYGVYDDKLRTLLHLLKYDGIEGLAKHLGELVAEQVAAIPGLPSELLAVPVPLYGKKRKTRGFNQSELLARGLMAALRQQRPEMRIKLAAALLVRQRETQSQAGLSPHARRENVRGAFCVPRPEVVSGRDILLVDDIYTTGATARACSTALMRAGARAVWVATVARAQKELVLARDGAGARTVELPERDAETAEIPMEEDFAMWEETGRSAKAKL